MLNYPPIFVKLVQAGAKGIIKTCKQHRSQIKKNPFISK
jgi:hypothetical protein